VFSQSRLVMCAETSDSFMHSLWRHSRRAGPPPGALRCSVRLSAAAAVQNVANAIAQTNARMLCPKVKERVGWQLIDKQPAPLNCGVIIDGIEWNNHSDIP
jgi:hypothetical protein